MFPRKRQDDLLVGVVYPGPYALGMSNLGFQWLLRRVESTDGFFAERFVADRGHLARLGSLIPRSLETGRTAAECHLLAVSIAYEPDFPAFLRFLLASGIPLESRDRDARHPLILAGGSAFQVNPAPMSPFVDAVATGDGENSLPRLLAAYAAAADREAFLDQAATVPGVWVPRATTAGSGGRSPSPSRVLALPAADDDLQVSGPPFSNILSPDAEFADTLLVEISRGCPGGCRFCWAGYRHRPPRAFPAGAVLDLAREARPHTTKIGLVSTAVFRHPEIDQIFDALLELGYAIGVSSLRMGDLTPERLHRLAAAGEDSVTLAPETGSSRLGRIVNKPFEPEQVREACRQVFSAGVKKLRLYFMVGLPGEEEEDVEASLRLAEAIHGDFARAQKDWDRPGAVSVSVSPFVPRPHTPFARDPMAPPALLRRRLQAFRDRLGRLANLEVRTGSLSEARLQWRLGAGDLATARSLADLARGRISEREFIDADHGWHPAEDGSLHPAPWDFIDRGFHPGFLPSERAKAAQGLPSPPCPGLGSCNNCRLCRPPG